MRAPFGQRFAAAIGGLPGAFWTIWLGLIVNRLASFVLAFLSIYLVRERGFRTVEAGRVLALYGVGMIIAGPLGGLLSAQARQCSDSAPAPSGCSASQSRLPSPRSTSSSPGRAEAGSRH